MRRYILSGSLEGF